MQRRLFSQLLAASLLFPSSLVKAFEQQLIAQSGSLPPAQKIQRVFVAGMPALVFIYALAPEKLIGFPTDLAARTRQNLAQPYADLPNVGRLAGRGSTLSMEQLMLLKPDIIVDVGNANETYRSAAEQVTQQTGIATLQVAGNLAQTPDQLRQVGKLLGVTERGQRLAAYAEQVLARAASYRAKQMAGPSFYHARGELGLETGLSGSIHTEVYELLGLRNVAQTSGRKGLAQISIEQLLVWQPDYIFTEELSFYHYAQQDPLFKQLKAVQNGRIYCAPRLPFGWLDNPPGLNRLLGVDWLLGMLNDQDQQTLLANQVSHFYQLFYGVSIDGNAALKLQV